MQRLNPKLLFLLVGGIAFIVDALTYFIVVDLFDIQPFGARFIAFLVAVGVTTYGNRILTFAKRSHLPFGVQYIKAILAALLSLVPNMIVFLGLIKILPHGFIYTLFAFGSGTIVGIFLNFFLSKHYVFTEKPLF
jgi:putative flippase GtrA